MTPETRALIEAAEESLDRFPYSCQKGQMEHCRCGDCVQLRLRTAISSTKAAEEGVETKNAIPPESSGKEGARQINRVLDEAIGAAESTLVPSSNMTQIMAVEKVVKAIRAHSR